MYYERVDIERSGSSEIFHYFSGILPLHWNNDSWDVDIVFGHRAGGLIHKQAGRNTVAYRGEVPHCSGAYDRRHSDHTQADLGCRASFILL